MSDDGSEAVAGSRSGVLPSRWTRSFAGRCVHALVEVQAVDRAMVLASQTFTALVPLLLVASTAAPRSRGDALADAVVRRFALEGESADDVRQVFTIPATGTVGVLSVLLLAISGLALTRRLQRTYLLAWRMEPARGTRASLDAALGLSALLVEIMLLASVHSVVRTLPSGWVLGAPASLVASVTLWTTVPWLLLDRRLRWRRLLPGGLLAAVCMAACNEVTTWYMPPVMARYSRQYGLFGVTLAVVGWLLSIALIVVVTAVVAAEVDRTDGGGLTRLRDALTGAAPRPRGDAR